MSVEASQPSWPRGSGVQPQDLVITILGSYVHHQRRTVWSGGLVTLLGDFGFSPGAARIALIRLVNRGFLERTRKGRLAFYTLSARGRKLLDEGDQRIFSLGKAPPTTDCWTILWHAIPEDLRLERGRLARRLRFLGFGTLQDGTWISPHDREREVVEVVDDLGVAQFTGVLIGRPALALDFGKFVSRVWPMEELSERYRSYVEEFGRYASGKRGPRLDDREAFLVRTRAVHTFRNFPAEDPELPDDLMSEPGFRAEAVQLFTTLYERLAEPSERYFSAVMEPPASRATAA
ncbi:MAG TPA: PaaX family transcriptional regulator C-terminal domain-containing protein [Conexibacter sp.]|nr:PaaX family transcriptional regulator C-terminal domain-containing protein [Conexibacter sp.]